MLNSGQNERSLLIIVSYIIGFVTAFILYGINYHLSSQQITSSVINSSVSTSTLIKITATNTKITRDKAPVYIDSFDKKFSFFCTKTNTDLSNTQDMTDTCQTFIRVNQTGEIKPLTINGEILTLAPDLLEIVYWSQTDNYLQIGEDIRSESYLEPWILSDVVQEEQGD